MSAIVITIEHAIRQGVARVTALDLTAEAPLPTTALRTLARELIQTGHDRATSAHLTRKTGWIVGRTTLADLADPGKAEAIDNMLNPASLRGRGPSKIRTWHDAA